MFKYLVLFLIVFKSYTGGATENIFFRNIKTKPIPQQVLILKKRIKIDSRLENSLSSAENFEYFFSIESSQKEAIDYLATLIDNGSTTSFKQLFIDYYFKNCLEISCLNKLTRLMKIKDLGFKNSFNQAFWDSYTLKWLSSEMKNNLGLKKLLDFELQTNSKGLFRVLKTAIELGDYAYAKKISEKYSKNISENKWLLHKTCVLNYLLNNYKKSLACFDRIEGPWFEMYKLYVNSLEKKSSALDFKKIDSIISKLSKSNTDWYKPIFIKLLMGGQITPAIAQKLYKSKIWEDYLEGFILISLNKKHRFFKINQAKHITQEYTKKYDRTLLVSVLNREKSNINLKNILSPSAQLYRATL